MDRKEFVRNTSLAMATLAVTPANSLFEQHDDARVKVAIIGVGLRGQNHLDLLLRRKDVDLVAICDIDERMLKSSRDRVSKSGKKMPSIYSEGDYAWKKAKQKGWPWPDLHSERILYDP